MKAVVLLSGGIDSTTCLAGAVKDFGAENVKALCLSYGQKHKKELESAYKVAKYYGVQLVEEEVNCFQFSDCSLLVGREDIKHESYAEQLATLGGEGTVDTYVPFRNGILLSIAAAYAYSIGADYVYYGAHADDAAGRAYPDCTPEFVDSMNNAIFWGTGKKVKIVAPLLMLNKAEVVKLGLKLQAPYALTWSCYEGGEKPCGKCGTCIDRMKAFEVNGIVDPILK